MAEWLACRTRLNPGVLGSSPALDLFLDSPEFKSSATLVNSQLICLRPVGIVNNVMLSFNICFSCLLGPTGTFAMNNADGK